MVDRDSAPTMQETEKGLSKDIQGVSEGLLPGLSKEADAEKEGGLLPKQSDFVIKEEPATAKVFPIPVNLTFNVSRSFLI